MRVHKAPYVLHPYIYLLVFMKEPWHLFLPDYTLGLFCADSKSYLKYVWLLKSRSFENLNTLGHGPRLGIHLQRPSVVSFAKNCFLESNKKFYSLCGILISKYKDTLTLSHYFLIHEHSNWIFYLREIITFSYNRFNTIAVDGMATQGARTLTHILLDNMAVISQTTFLDTF